VRQRQRLAVVGLLTILAVFGLAADGLMQTDTESASCDCRSLETNRECKKRTIQYEIEIPEGCSVSGLSMIDATSGTALWDRTIRTQEEFESLVEQGLPNGTEITIKRRAGDARQWFLEFSSCCHTIPTLQIHLDCPGTEMARHVYVGVWFTDDDQYTIHGEVVVDGRRLSMDNLNTFFSDCSVPYCDFPYPHDADAGGANGGLRLFVTPDTSCALDLVAFRRDLISTLEQHGCVYKSTQLAPDAGILKGFIYTNICTPRVVACIQEVLSRYSQCKEIQWTGRQVVIRPKGAGGEGG